MLGHTPLLLYSLPPPGGALSGNRACGVTWLDLLGIGKPAGQQGPVIDSGLSSGQGVDGGGSQARDSPHEHVVQNRDRFLCGRSGRLSGAQRHGAGERPNGRRKRPCSSDDASGDAQRAARQTEARVDGRLHVASPERDEDPLEHRAH